MGNPCTCKDSQNCQTSINTITSPGMDMQILLSKFYVNIWNVLLFIQALCYCRCHSFLLFYVIINERAVIHVGIANPRWRGKRSRHSRTCASRNFAYLEILQYLYVMFFWHLCFSFFSTGSIDVLDFMIALHSFLLSFSMYSGLLLIVGFVLFSHQCFVLVLCSASAWVLFPVISVICLFMAFFI